MEKRRISFKYGSSRGKNSYGYTICSMYVDGKKVGMQVGGGYDLKGAVLGEWIEAEFAELLDSSKEDLLYGMTRDKNGTVNLDGATGVSCMIEVLKNFCGMNLIEDYDSEIGDIYDLVEIKEREYNIKIQKLSTVSLSINGNDFPIIGTNKNINVRALLFTWAIQEFGEKIANIAYKINNDGDVYYFIQMIGNCYCYATKKINDNEFVLKLR